MDMMQATEIIAGTIRYKSGAWHLVSDTKHTNKGISKVSKDGEYIRISFKNKASRVLTFVVDEDESLVSSCISAGASVGLDRALIKLGSCRNTKPADGANLWIYGIIEVENGF